MIPKPKEIHAHAMGIVDDDARLRFLANCAADAARLADHLSGLTSLAVEDAINRAAPKESSDE